MNQGRRCQSSEDEERESPFQRILLRVDKIARKGKLDLLIKELVRNKDKMPAKVVGTYLRAIRGYVSPIRFEVLGQQLKLS